MLELPFYTIYNRYVFVIHRYFSISVQGHAREIEENMDNR